MVVELLVYMSKLRRSGWAQCQLSSLHCSNGDHLHENNANSRLDVAGSAHLNKE
jgi:hypothetical protein